MFIINKSTKPHIHVEAYCEGSQERIWEQPIPWYLEDTQRLSIEYTTIQIFNYIMIPLSMLFFFSTW